MRVVYYTRPCYLDLALEYAAELAKQVELHLVVEIAPESRKSSIFDIGDKKLQTGLIDGVTFFKVNFQKLYVSYLAECASVTLVIHNCPQSFHPSTWKVNLEAMNFCRTIKPDIIHFDGIVPRTASAIWRLRNIPLVSSVHDPIRHSGEESWRKELARKITFPFVDRFLLHSAAMKETFLARYPKVSSARVVHNPLAAYNIYCQWIKTPLQDDGRTVLFFGRLSHYKGIEVLVQAAPIIAQQVKGVRIVIAGRPVHGYSLPLLPPLANGGKFEVLDTYIDNDLLAKLFQQATLVACPYIDASQSGVVLTAYGFGKPVIVTNTGGLPEYIWQEKTGCIVPPGDHQHLAQSICSILADPATQQETKSNIEEMKKVACNWKNVADKNVKIYSELLDE
ncbi:glycosyltransferase family 4 protein [Desulfogranum marinum]|uniref:glycosyltransferase family 4 protein n=1 Tax=Desulfogranum marinum TaxID=453220 RepID=UPI0029C998D7|nr:glycosyltransferase family 4 protein [Desulfogranum marinum]